MDAKILPAYLMPYPVESFSKPILIASDRTFIGRGVDGGIQIADRRISRNHACIQFNEGHFLIEDLDSHNGTFLNNKRIRQARLNHRDKISIVDRTFLFLYRQASVHELLAEPSVEATDTIPISIEEIQLSDFWAQGVNHAARKFIESAGSEASSRPQFDRLAHERLSLLYRLSENLRSTDSTDTVYDQGTDLMLDAIHGAKCVLIAVRSPTRDSFKVVSCKFRKPHEEGDNIPVSHTLFDWVISENVTLISQNLRDDDRFTDSESIRIHDLRSIICVPITATKQAMGLLYLQASDQLDPFNKADAVFASAVANEMALTIENLRLHKQLVQLESMAAIGLTVGNLAHNMKNLLAVNQGAGHLMDAHLKERDYEQIEKRWQQIKRGLEGIGRLSIEMLAFVKKDDLYLKPVDVNQLILSNRQTIEHSFAHDGLSIQYLLSPKRPVWKLDGVQFQRALQNLVLNAVDAVAKKKKAIIRISTSVRKERYLLVSVADNGCGIPKDRLKRVLELFYTTKGTRGTGLGLPTVNKFVQQSGGKLKLVSKEGRGTIFQMVFPRR